MPEGLLVTLASVASAIITAIVTAYVTIRRLPSDIRSADAATDKAQHEASKIIAESAKALAESLRIEIAGLQQRLTEAERRIAAAEGKAANAEKRAAEFRSELIKVGTMLDQARKQINELVAIVRQAGLKLPDWANTNGAR